MYAKPPELKPRAWSTKASPTGDSTATGASELLWFPGSVIEPRSVIFPVWESTAQAWLTVPPAA